METCLRLRFAALTSFRIAGATGGCGRHRYLSVTAPLAYNNIGHVWSVVVFVSIFRLHTSHVHGTSLAGV